MTQQEQLQFTTTLQLIVPQVIDRIVKEYGPDATDAMKQLYESHFYADLERENSKLWHLSHWH